MRKTIREIRDIARLDIYRDKRCGIPEVIFAEGKEPKWVVELLVAMTKGKGTAIATRVDNECFKEIKRIHRKNFRLVHYAKARMVVLSKADHKLKTGNGRVGLMAAGTADIPVAEEAKCTMELLGCKVITAYDVGIAGMHRLFEPLEGMLKEKVACIVVVAGMEGALPTVVKSLVDVPVIGVPVSTGYGYGGKGESALMTMLQSCSPGLVVVNVDNGFGAGCAAALIARQSIYRKKYKLQRRESMALLDNKDDPMELADKLNFKEKVDRSLTLIKEAYEKYGNGLVVANSLGKDSLAVWDLVKRVNPQIRGFIVTTRFQHKETVEFMYQIVKRYPELKVFKNDVEIPDGLYRTDPDRCCGLLKVEPTSRAIKEMGAACWVTGLRCTEGRTRTDYKEVEERDPGLLKLNPILIWKEREVWQYLALYSVQVNPIYKEGYRSLDCYTCTQITTDDNERSGRWVGTSKCGGECGIHTRPLKTNVEGDGI